jgi:KaiC/GvpD/RAD55 family RecA-like ATPase
MNGNGQIPPATLEKLAAPTPKGTRHQAAIGIAVPMIGNGLTEAAVFATLRSKFEPDVTDNELWGVIKWVAQHHPKPSRGAQPVPRREYSRPSEPTPARPSRNAEEQCDWWTSGARLSPDGMAKISPTPIPEDPAEQAILALSALYREADMLNIVCKFSVDDKNPGKTRPQGGGKVLLRDDWVSWIKRNGAPKRDAGAWFRMNPCAIAGTGADGAITDGDVTDCRYMLVESDDLPIACQLALYSRLKLPVAAVVMSGGASAHAWVHVGAADGQSYSEVVRRILSALKPFGVDQANKNPSRLSRMPGSVRKIGGVGDGLQRLLLVNSATAPITEKALLDFEESLVLPAIEEKPLKTLAQNAVARYRDMKANAGRLGVPYGIDDLDESSGGMKPGQTVVVAGATGGCKTTMALHITHAALERGYGVLLFSLEMDRDEIFDLVMCRRAQVDRNKFNNGRFSDYDLDLMIKAMPEVKELPLYIDDSPLTGADQIRLRVLQLKNAGKIGLVVVDYIQFVNPEWTRDSREQQIATISHRLRALAREARVPMLILSQLNDEGKIRESRVVSHNANVVMLVEVEGDIVTAKIVKGRGIPLAEYKLEFQRIFGKLIPIRNDNNNGTHPTNNPF